MSIKTTLVWAIGIGVGAHMIGGSLSTALHKHNNPNAPVYTGTYGYNVGEGWRCQARNTVDNLSAISHCTKPGLAPRELDTPKEALTLFLRERTVR